ncbi:50S ribosomal protein L18 [Medicago truncatula]|uniref:50S ribosomal protein L18 n=1 Tax=Medicago truncatula TaxID=3880 RepID=G7IQC2_MEDTR|nr:50S ribosomal protein L18 [Medicago truncatula]
MLTSSLSFLHSCTFPSSSSSSSSSLFTIPTPNPNSSSSSLSFVVQATTRREDRIARHVRLRKKIEGTPERPRLSVFRSNKHLFVQVIDDTKMHTLASASTMQKAIAEELNFTSGPTIQRGWVRSLQNPVWKKESQR